MKIQGKNFAKCNVYTGKSFINKFLHNAGKIKKFLIVENYQHFFVICI